NIDKSRRRIDSARDQTNCALYFCRGWIVHSHDRNRRAFLRGREVLRFHAQFYFDLVLGNDLHQRTASWNNLSILRVHFGDHARNVRVDALIASRAGALQSRDLRLCVARSSFRRAVAARTGATGPVFVCAFRTPKRWATESSPPIINTIASEPIIVCFFFIWAVTLCSSVDSARKQSPAPCALRAIVPEA